MSLLIKKGRRKGKSWWDTSYWIEGFEQNKTNKTRSKQDQNKIETRSKQEQEQKRGPKLWNYQNITYLPLVYDLIGIQQWYHFYIYQHGTPSSVLDST